MHRERRETHFKKVKEEFLFSPADRTVIPTAPRWFDFNLASITTKERIGASKSSGREAYTSLFRAQVEEASRFDKQRTSSRVISKSFKLSEGREVSNRKRGKEVVMGSGPNLNQAIIGFEGLSNAREAAFKKHHPCDTRWTWGKVNE
jgi:hypothetical protein